MAKSFLRFSKASGSTRRRVENVNFDDVRGLEQTASSAGGFGDPGEEHE